jgi:hypothetical protein
MGKSTRRQLVRKYIYTLSRRMEFLESRAGGSYDRQEIAALRAAIVCLEKEGGGSRAEVH